jgi:hypothetical protein
MTTEREKDPDATVRMPQPLPRLDRDTEDFDPDKTLVREDWESVKKDIQLLRDAISRPCGARIPHLFPYKLRILRSSERELTPLITF